MVELAQVETRVDQVKGELEQSKAALVKIGATLGGVHISSPQDIDVIALRLARGKVAVPVHCRDNAGVVYALVMQALEWGMPIMSVINKSYVVVNKGVERIAYESQVIHAVVEKNAPLRHRLRHRFIGEGDDMVCEVWGTFIGETDPHSWTSLPLATMREMKGRNEYGKIKGSPLWDTMPKVQLYYSTTMIWARVHAPDVILGAYTPEELEDGSELKDVTPAVGKMEEMAARLRGLKAARGDDRGFDAEHIEREASMRSTIIDGEINPDAAKTEDTKDERRNEPDAEGQQGGTVGGDVRDPEQGGGERDDRPADQVLSEPAGQEGAQQQPKQQDIFKDQAAPASEKPKGKPKGKQR